MSPLATVHEQCRVALDDAVAFLHAMVARRREERTNATAAERVNDAEDRRDDAECESAAAEQEAEREQRTRHSSPP